MLCALTMAIRMNGKLRVLGLLLGIWAFTGVAAWLALQNIPRTTCEQTEDEQDYDLLITHVAPEYGEPPLITTNMDVRVSGEDFHAIITTEDKEVTVENIVKDGEHFEKRAGGEWERKEEAFADIGFIWYLIDSRPYYTQIPSEHVLCAVEGEDFRITKMWFTAALGPKFAWGNDWESNPWIAPAYATELPDTEARWEYWPTIKGHMYQSRQIFNAVGGEDWEVIEITTEISEVGVPNVITAPVP